MKITPRQAEAVKFYKTGLSCMAVGKLMGCTPTAVWNLLRRAGVQPRAKNNPDKWDSRKDEIEHLYFVADMSQEQIAAYFGVTQTVIYKVMVRLGIKAKPKWRAGEKNGRYKHGLASRMYRSVITKDKCRLCGSTENLGIHHKNDDHYDNRLENLEVLCNSCHMSEHKRKWWAAKKTGRTLPKSNAPTGWTSRPKRK